MVLLDPEPVIAPGLIVQVPAGKPFNITLPVAIVHVGWVTVPTVGAVGAPGAVLITTLAEAAEVHPAASVTVKLYVAAASPGIVVLAPVPETAPGFMVQLPAGNPLNITLPVGTAHVGWVMVPTIGVVGIAGCAFIITFTEAAEVQPAALVTVKL